MSTSGSIDFSLTRDDLITDAMRFIGAIGEGETPTSYEISNAARALNMLVKQWQGSSDFSASLKVWSRKRGYLFLAKDTVEYSLGTTGDNWTNDYVSTTTTAAQTSGNSTITVDSATGLAANMYIGVELTTGALQWTTISGTPTTTVTLAASLTANVASGARVFAYTTKAYPPLDIQAVSLRDSSGNDSPLWIIPTVQQYEAIPSKTVDGMPYGVLFERSIPNGRLLTTSAPTDLTYVIRVTYTRPLDDFDSTADEVDYPQSWFRALKFGLAREIAPEMRRAWTDDRQMLLTEALALAKQSDPEVSRSSFEPNREE